jgi:hypothetical protein
MENALCFILQVEFQGASFTEAIQRAHFWTFVTLDV